MAEKIIRDPVHDVIGFHTDSPLDALLLRLINADEFQRLRRIRQLGMAHLAYPGADHSRYSHSIGVMHTAGLIVAQLSNHRQIDEELRVVCMCAALLHDLGHGPFSHVFERVSGMDHEELTRQVIADPDSQVHRFLAEHDRALPKRVIDFMAGTGPRTFFHDILSSQLDADRFDYLLRDNLMTGSGYGNYDLQWLLHALVVDDSSNRLAVSWKGVSAVEAYLQARYHMYRNVYFHKVVRSAEGMVKLALQRAKRLAVQGRLGWPTRESNVYRALVGQKLTIEQFRDFDDISVMHCFKVWSECDDASLAMLCRGLLYRRLYKTIDLTYADEPTRVATAKRIEDEIHARGGDPTYDMFYDEPADTPYETYDANDTGAGKEILVKHPDGRLLPFASISPLSQVLNQQLMFRRIHAVREVRISNHE